MKKDCRYTFCHKNDGTLMEVAWNQGAKEWYGENGRFDFSRKSAKEAKAMLDRWGYDLKPIAVSKLR
jgi:hypothetical protein